MINLSGARALVTGGSRGIGAATARLLAQSGAQVVVGYRSRMADATKVVEELRAFGVRAEAFGADISTREGAESLVAETLRVFGGLDLFVGNAGIWPAEEVPLTEMDDERWLRTIRENIDSIFYTTRAVAGAMSDRGRIVLVSSTAGQRGEAMHADYAATKGAVISFTKSLAVELAPREITVNAVAPGWVDTDMVAQPMAGAGRAQIASSIPLGRIATAEDIAGPILFLCSPLARHITGEILNVNGGSVLCG
ncbi:MAG TPA: SDR family NAD(P)-dependent oxidoreductase [Gemmatimonadaceae bacterium]